MTVGRWCIEARERLSRSGSPDPRPDAEWMLCRALTTDRAHIRMRWNEEMDDGARTACDEMLARREAGEPLQYILGEAWFYARRFLCDERALIPRQDTETLCESALASMPTEADADVLDLCTGSGILAITIALERPRARVTGADISEKAISLAKDNARLLSANVDWALGDLFAAVPGKRFDRIVCNPPYLTAKDMENLQREVRAEPENALFGGEDGLSFYRRISEEAPAFLRDGGMLFLEIGIRQSEPVLCALADRRAYAETGVIQDLNGYDRVIWARV